MRYFLDPFGCVKNQVDAETMMACLNGAGWVSSDDPGGADLIIVNSCGFIESAKRESINAVLAWRKRYPGKKILLAGCLPRRYEKELAESLPEADILFGNGNLTNITEAAGRAAGQGPEIPGGYPLSGAAVSAPAVIPGQRPLLSLPGSAYVKISEGCNNRCSFCAIPLIRGPLVCRPVPDIVDECRTLFRRGVREINLIGQDTGSYGLDRDGAEGSRASALPDLLRALSALEGRFWVRLLYIHPDSFPLSILDILGQDSRFLPYFDIPFQHGSPKILATMNRRGDTETCLSLIGKIRERLPAAVIRSTFMTGFPGETEEDFAALLDFQERARFDWLGCFVYSREDGTPAWSMKRRVPKKTALERKRIIEERQIPITGKNMDRFIGKEYDVLVEEKIGEEEGLCLGRLYCQAPEVDGAAVIHCEEGRPLPEPGTFVKCRVFARAGFDLRVLTGGGEIQGCFPKN
ncbi:MAG: 30S ribosomal protein S12 methylthiotransferase RimO [Treponema sp.]|jgi:ribosomal protein S12 methylthiotransferase|nr:30S ribosomal protein S12 methylthiotransferase RimO [Treponema sp.]